MHEPDDFSALFAPEPEAPANVASDSAAPDSRWKVLLVDDEPDIHAVLRLAIQDIVIDGRGLWLLDARSAKEARACFAQHPDIALVLLDVVMESADAGLGLVRHIRHELANRITQIILVTGQPGYAPEREVITEYAIDGYRLKSELTADKIFVSVFAALRTHQAQRDLAQYRQKLEELVVDRTAALQKTNQQLADTQFAMDRAGIGIHWVSADTGQLIYVNNHAAELLGYTVDEMLCMRVPDIDPNFTPEDLVVTTQSLFAMRTATFESIQLRKDGRRIPVEITFYCQPASENTERRIICFITEITQRKAVEDALRHAKDAAETANRAKSAFLARISHEILTPINGILGMAHLMDQNGLSEKQAWRMGKIMHAGQHLLHIVNNLLDLSNIEAGQCVLDIQHFSVKELQQAITSTMHERLQGRSLTLHIALDALPDTLLGDAQRLRQILLNYLDNAVKFTERGSIELQAQVEAETADDLLIRFSVRDTGIGMTTEQQARLFQRFEQADNSSTRKYGGSGLGLAINKMLADLMGGEVGVSSQPDQGSTFWLKLRLGRSKKAISSVSSAILASAEENLRQNYRGSRLLVAEDDLTNQLVITELLRDTGFIVDLAEDGEQAVAMSAQGNYALILMDIQMPHLDGIEATRQIRARLADGATPIVAMTANAYADDKARCFAAGMNDFIAKPINPDIVFTTLLRWLPKPTHSMLDQPPPPAQHDASASSSMDEANQQLIQHLASVPGLDVARGISVVRGKTAKYIELLTQFVKNHANDIDRLSQCISAGDHAQASLLAHSLKGAAATLGMVSLAEAARQIEFRERDNNASHELQAEMNTLRHELENIAAALPSPAVSPLKITAPSAANRQLGERHLSELDERLANADFTAIAYFQEHAASLRDALVNSTNTETLAESFNTLSDQIRQFEFETARQTLNTLRTAHDPR